jgi:hypothetical protein
MAISPGQFIEHLIQSGLFSPDQLSTFQEDLPPRRRLQTAEALAHELVRARKLTKYQAAGLAETRPARPV